MMMPGMQGMSGMPGMPVMPVMQGSPMQALLKAASFTKRKSNFTYTETDLLLGELEKNKDLISSAAHTAKHLKRAMWDDITMKLNQIGEGDERTLEEVRKKWSDMQCLAKRKYAKGKQELNEFEARVIAIRTESESWACNDFGGSFSEDPEADCSNLEFGPPSEGDGIMMNEGSEDEDDMDTPPVHFQRPPADDDEDAVQDEEPPVHFGDPPVHFGKPPVPSAANGEEEDEEEDDDDDDDKGDEPQPPVHFGEPPVHFGKPPVNFDGNGVNNDQQNKGDQPDLPGNFGQPLVPFGKPPPVHFVYDRPDQLDQQHYPPPDQAVHPEVPLPPFDPLGKKRKSNFSVPERDALIEVCKKNMEVIMSKSNNIFAHEKKRVAWLEITEHVNRVGKGQYRTQEECRKKWNDMQSMARRKKMRKLASDARQAMAMAMAMGNPDMAMALGIGNADGATAMGNPDSQKGEFSGGFDQSMDGNEEGNSSIDGAEDSGSADHTDIMERVMASAYGGALGMPGGAKAMAAATAVMGDPSEWVFPKGKKRKLPASSSTPRKSNFTIYEINALLDEIYKRRRVIFAPNTDSIAAERKRTEWENIAHFVSEICNTQRRTFKEVRKKWKGLYTRATKGRGDNTEQDKCINNKVLFILDQRNEEHGRMVDQEFDECFSGIDGEEETSMDNGENNGENPETDGNDTSMTQPGSEGDNTNSSGVKGPEGGQNGEDGNDQKEAASSQDAEKPESAASFDERMFALMNRVSASSEDDGKSNSTQGNSLLTNMFGMGINFESSVASAEQLFSMKKGKFNGKEIGFLLEEVKKNKTILLSKLNAAAINEKKKVIWNEITERLNRVRQGGPRTVEEVKKKWYDLQFNAKKKRALQESLLQRIQTNENVSEVDEGGKTSAYHPSHQKLLSLLGPTGRQSSPEKLEDGIKAEANVNGVESDEVTREEKSQSVDDSTTPSLAISTDKVRDNVQNAPNILTNTDWKVLQITDARLSQVNNHEATPASAPNYEGRFPYADRPGSMSMPAPLPVPGRHPDSMKFQPMMYHAAATANPRKPDGRKGYYGNQHAPAPSRMPLDNPAAPSRMSSDVEQQRLRYERKRLMVERRRLNVEQEKLRLLRRLVEIEEDKRRYREEQEEMEEENEEEENNEDAEEEKNEVDSLALQYFQYD